MAIDGKEEPLENGLTLSLCLDSSFLRVWLFEVWGSRSAPTPARYTSHYVVKSENGWVSGVSLESTQNHDASREPGFSPRFTWCFCAW